MLSSPQPNCFVGHESDEMPNVLPCAQAVGSALALGFGLLFILVQASHHFSHQITLEEWLVGTFGMNK